MPVRIDPGDRKILIAAAIVLVLLLSLALLFAPSQRQTGSQPSSYSAAPRGAKAAFLVLRKLGYEVERWERPPMDLPEEALGTILVLAQPNLHGSAEEQHALHSFLRRGGRILVTENSTVLPGCQPPPEKKEDKRNRPLDVPLEIRLWQPCEKAVDGPLESEGQKVFPATLPSPISREAQGITMAADTRWRDMRSGVQLPLYGDEKGAVVVKLRYGSGTAYWWADSTPLTNSGLREPGSLALLLNTLGDPAETRVLWDEFYHGISGSLWSYLSRTPVLWALAQAGLVFLAVLITFARRSGPVRAPVAESRLSPLEFVMTLGGLYQRAGAAASAVGISYQRFRHLIQRRLGLSPGVPIDQLYASVRERLQWREPGLYETLQQCEGAVRRRNVTEEQALGLVQALEQYSRLLRLVDAPRDVRRRARAK